MGEVAKVQEQALVDAAKRDLVSAEARDDRRVVAEDTGRRVTLRGYFVGAMPSGSAVSSRWLHLVVFLLVVGLPTLLAGIYYGFIASDQYVTEIRFGVRSADADRNDVTGMIQGGSSSASASQIMLQSNVVVEYMKSREIVDSVNKDVDLRRIFSLPSVDYFSRLDPDIPVEGLVSYWRGKVEPFFDQTTGIVSVRVRAFTREDALRIGNDVVRLSEGLADELSLRARADYVKFAQDQVDEARAHLTRARDALLQFRNSGQTLDPVKEADAARLGLGKLREELARVETDMGSVRTKLGPTSPTMIALKDRQAAIQQEIKAAEARFAGTDAQSGRLSSQDIRGFDNLETERQLAEKFYDSALQALRRAQFEASRKSMYLEVFVRPTLPEQSLYPRRFVSALIVALSAFGVWIFLMMTYYSVREHI